MKYRFVDYFIPFFIAIYFVIAFSPIFTRRSTEIFPFFSFNLFSQVPNGFERYDLVFDLGEKEERFLIYGNTDLEDIERQYLNGLVPKIAKKYESTKIFDDEKITRFFPKNSSVTLVKIKGDFIEIYKKQNYELEPLGKLN
ncbi:MAG: hypothetical protein AB8H03_14580 [Saprospiraceae bacterium]